VEILDLRSSAVRAAEGLWRRPRGGWLLRGLSAATGAVVGLGMNLRVMTRGKPPPDVLVISVGNLALGGTGKTPVVRQLARDLALRGRRGTVLTRGYGSAHPGPLEVRADDERAGDESRLLAASLGPLGWRVVQSRHRRRGLQVALRARPRPEVVVVEDGFQTSGVPRHLDVLIVDRWRLDEGPTGPVLAPETGLVFPWGPYREDERGAARAAVWLVEAESAPTGGRPGSSPSAVVSIRPLPWRLPWACWPVSPPRPASRGKRWRSPGPRRFSRSAVTTIAATTTPWSRRSSRRVGARGWRDG